MPKNAEKYYCKLCDFGCSKQSNYDNHISTRKHKMIVNYSKMIVKKCQNKYACICGKSYKHDSGYYKHKKTCTYVEEKEENTNEKIITQNSGGTDNTELVVQLINSVATQIINPLVSSHNDLQNLVVNELIPKIGNTNCNNNNTMNNTTNNNKFNMNIYLNEKCKDAMTLSDFIDNLQISDEDFETTRTEGIVSGLTDIFTKELRNLDVRKLPIHCSDIKRETFYIKEDNEWVKDDGKKSIL